MAGLPHANKPINLIERVLPVGSLVCERGITRNWRPGGCWRVVRYKNPLPPVLKSYRFCLTKMTRPLANSFQKHNHALTMSRETNNVHQVDQNGHCPTSPSAFGRATQLSKARPEMAWELISACSQPTPRKSNCVCSIRPEHRKSSELSCPNTLMRSGTDTCPTAGTGPFLCLGEKIQGLLSFVAIASFAVVSRILPSRPCQKDD
jgi:hypothetical protein